MKKTYVATPKDIRALVVSLIAASDAEATVRGNYLKCLVGTTQREMQLKPDASPVALLQRVHRTFYKEVVDVAVTPDLRIDNRNSPEEAARRTAERGRRTNFARSAKSTLLSWMRVDGHDIARLKADKVTKASLAKETPVRQPRKVSADVLHRRLETGQEALLRQAKALVKVDANAAQTFLEAAIGELNGLLVTAGGKSMRQARVPAAHGHRAAIARANAENRAN